MNNDNDFLSHVTELHAYVLATPKGTQDSEESVLVLDCIQKIGESIEAEMKSIAQWRDLTPEEADAVLELSRTLRTMQNTEKIWLQGHRKFEQMTAAVNYAQH